MRIDVATASNNLPKSIFARIGEDAEADALEGAVAHLEDDAPVAYRVVADDEAETLREDGHADTDATVGAWVFVTAGELEKMKPSNLMKGEGPAPKAKRKR